MPIADAVSNVSISRAGKENRVQRAAGHVGEGIKVRTGAGSGTRGIALASRRLAASAAPNLITTHGRPADLSPLPDMGNPHNCTLRTHHCLHRAIRHDSRGRA